MIESPSVVIRPPELPAFPPFVKYDADNPFLTAEECAKLVEYATQKPMANGTIGNGSNDAFYHDANYRTVKQVSLQCQADELDWLFERVRDRVDWVNRDYFGFDLHGLLEGMQFLQYSEQEGGHYQWHQDYGGGYSSHRKLSVVIQLSDPDDYEGCRLRLFTQGDYEVPTIAQGTGVIFPSWQPHCVTPITRGMRHALVCWVSGPRFR